MKEITIPAPLVHAALQCKANRDVRYYLNGIFLSSKGFIASANGHVAFKADIDSAPDEDVILNLFGTVPASYENVIFSISDSNEGIARLVHSNIEKNKLIAFEKIDGNYPHIEKVFPDEGDESQSIKHIGLNADYLSLTRKIFGAHEALRMDFFGGTKAVAVSSSKSVFKNSQMLIMPVRV